MIHYIQEGDGLFLKLEVKQIHPHYVIKAEGAGKRDSAVAGGPGALRTF